MDVGPYLVEAHLREGRGVAELARVHGVHRSWLYKLLARYRREGDAGLLAPLAPSAPLADRAATRSHPGDRPRAHGSPGRGTYRGGAEAAPYLAAAVVLTLVGFALLYGRAAWLAGSLGKASVVMLALGASVLFAPSFPLLVGWLFYFLGMNESGSAGLRSRTAAVSP